MERCSARSRGMHLQRGNTHLKMGADYETNPNRFVFSLRLICLFLNLQLSVTEAIDLERRLGKLERLLAELNKPSREGLR